MNEPAFFTVIPHWLLAHKLPHSICRVEHAEMLPGFSQQCLAAFVFDYYARQKVCGDHLDLQLFEATSSPATRDLHPTLSLAGHASSCDTHQTWLLPRVLELTYTAWDLQPFARDCGYDGPPFRWDEDRRFLLRCELDAAYFHLYGIARDDVDYIMETFPIVKRKDVAAHGEYRTKRVILEIYDAMQRAMDTGEPYQTRLDPPPADPPVAHEGQPPEWLDNTPSRATRTE